MVCAIEALALVAVVGFFVIETWLGATQRVGLAVVEAVFIALFALALGFMTRGWVVGDSWQRSPTIVWNLLLIPVVWSLLRTPGWVLAGAILGVVALVGVVSAILAGRDGDKGGSVQG